MYVYVYISELFCYTPETNVVHLLSRVQLFETP